MQRSLGLPDVCVIHCMNICPVLPGYPALWLHLMQSFLLFRRVVYSSNL